MSRPQPHEMQFSPSTKKDLLSPSSPKKRVFDSLWINSPCSYNYPKVLPPIDKANRFELNSIYHRDDPFKPAQKTSEIQKPDILLIEFRKSIREIDKYAHIKNKELMKERSIKKEHRKKFSWHPKVNKQKIRFEEKENLRQSQFHKEENNEMEIQIMKQKQIVNRLCPKNPKVLKLQYDRYGNRSSFYANEQQKPQQRKSPKNLPNRNDSFFTDSERIDMSRPENFNPGPGTYFRFSKLIKQNMKINIKKKNQKLGHLKNSQSQHQISLSPISSPSAYELKKNSDFLQYSMPRASKLQKLNKPQQNLVQIVQQNSDKTTSLSESTVFQQ